MDHHMAHQTTTTAAAGDAARPTYYLIGQRDSAETRDLRTFLVRNRVPFQWVDLERDPLVRFLVGDGGLAEHRWPLCLLPDGTRLEAPSRLELARCVGLHTRPSEPEYDLAIIGAGPAGLAAAVNAASEGLRTVVIEREAPGGQAGSSSGIENYPGFPDGISGMALAERMLQQAERFGAEFVLVNEVVAANAHHRAPFHFSLLDGTELRCHTTIVATGVTYQQLDVPGVARLNGHGVYYGSALSEAPLYSGKDVFVVGGGNSAGQTALHLAQFARSVTVLVRSSRSTLRQSMSQYLIDRLGAIDTIAISDRTQVIRAEGATRLETVVLDHAGAERSVPADALFILIGQRPASDWAEGILLRDRRGFIVAGEDVLASEDGQRRWLPYRRSPLPLETAVPGVFACGDVRQGSMNRVAWAIGDGAQAVQSVHQYLGKHSARDRQHLQAAMPEHEHRSGEQVEIRRPGS
jgi:thioredoxin reductase (NADPH)